MRDHRLALPLVALTAFAAGPSVARADAETLEEVIVTAEKQEETLQKTAAAITAIQGDALVAAGVTDLRAAQKLVPSVRFQAEGANTEVYIRGVGSTLDLPNIEPPTTVNFNGIYIPREATSVPLFDIDQIEVLPGTQGTLYGRSVLGGAVNISFNRPTQDLGTEVLLKAGNYSLFHGTVTQNLPVNDTFALRGSVDYTNQDGYLETGADSRDDYGIRLSGLYEPNDDLSIYVWAQTAEKDGKSANLVRKGYNGGTFDGDPHAFESSDPWNDVITPDAPDAGSQVYEEWVVGAQVDWRFNGMTLTYVPSYLYLDWASNYWLENLPAYLSAHYNQVTQELRLSGKAGDRWDWLVGLYAYRVTNDGLFTVTYPPEAGGLVTLADVTRNRLEGLAAFGQATYSVSDSLRVVAGGRFSYDKREGDGRAYGVVPYDFDESFDNADWKLGVEYDVGKASMVYGNIQTGYQPGTYNGFPSTPEQSNLVEEASLTAFTIGAKNRFLSDRLQVNDEIFYYDYRDLFAQSFNLGTFLLTTFNAEKVEIYGNQLDILFQATDADLLNLSVGYLHARNKEFVVPDEINIGPGTHDFAGYSLQNAPDWTVSAGYQHDFRLDSGYLRARADTRYESSFWGTFAHNRGTEQEAYTKSDASLTYFADSDRWSIGIWVRNIEDEAVQAAATAGQFGPYADVFLEPPRTYGVSVTARL